MILVFSLGFSLGRNPSQPESLTSTKSVFVLFFHDTEEATMDDGTRAGVYTDWVRELRASGRFAIGSKLRNSGRILQLADNRLNAIDVSMDHKMSNLRAYALIEAQDIDEAIRIASTNPYPEHHGILAVRQLEYVVE
jgi:hypothetical protein